VKLSYKYILQRFLEEVSSATRVCTVKTLLLNQRGFTQSSNKDEQPAQKLISQSKQVLKAWGKHYFDQFNSTQVEKLFFFFFLNLRQDLRVNQDL